MKASIQSLRPASARSFWLSSFADVPAPVLRTARYVLQMMARCPELQRRLSDDDFFDAAWALCSPIVDPRVMAKLQADCLRPGVDGDAGVCDNDGKEEGWTRRRRHRQTGSLLNGVPGERMRAFLSARFRAIPEALIKRLAAADAGGPTHPSVAVLAHSAGLQAIETAILDLVEKKATVPKFSVFLRETGTDSSLGHYACISAALDAPVRDLKQLFHHAGSLSALRLVKQATGRSDLEDFLVAGSLLGEILSLEPQTEAELIEQIIEPSRRPECVIDDFPHMTKDVRRVASVLSAACQGAVPGVNALFYGIPGTGKTQLALALAASAGLTPVAVRTADSDGDGLRREGRLGAYLLVQRLFRGRKDCVIIFDEIEDVFSSQDESVFAFLMGAGAKAGREKGWMNRMLEENPVPAIWITNDASSMDSAFLRRFLLPVAFKTPPRAVRRDIAARYLGHAVPSTAVLDELAADSALVPAQFSAARRLLDLQPDADPALVVREGIAASRSLIHGGAIPRVRKPATVFDSAYLNLSGGATPEQIGDALEKTGRGSLCFFGQPGTGKTEFAHVLADFLGRELVVRSSADLVSAYVGETEKNLAKLFNDIDTESSVLFLDEVDSLLRDRRQARHSWEITQVNQLLQQMESFPGVFIAATNMMANLDAAAMRRFTFKLEFRPLTYAQRLALFAREALGDESLAVQLPPLIAQKLRVLEQLTPGDFANVVRQRDLLGETLPVEEFLRRLVAEIRWKSVSASAA